MKNPFESFPKAKTLTPAEREKKSLRLKELEELIEGAKEVLKGVESDNVVEFETLPNFRASLEGKRDFKNSVNQDIAEIEREASRLREELSVTDTGEERERESEPDKVVSMEEWKKKETDT